MTVSAYSGRRFRAAALHYVLGRGLNALLSVALVVAVARALQTGDYAAYVALWALTELMLWLGNLGTDWVTALEIPRLRLAQRGCALRRLVVGVIGVQMLSFGGMSALWWATAPWLADALGGLPQEIVKWFALSFLVEGLSRSVRDQMLTALLLQWVSQTGQMLRNAAVLAFVLVAANSQGGLSVLELVRCEVAAAAVAAVLAGASLAFALRRVPREADVQPLHWHTLIVRGLQGWTGGLGGVVVSAQMALLLMARSAGAETTALLGFARNLAEQVRRFMPVEFGFMLLRTFIAARFAVDGNAALASHRAELVWRCNAVVVMTALVLAVGWGDAFGAWLSKERYAQAGWPLACWLAWVFCGSRRRLAETLAHTFGASAAAARLGLFVLPALLPLAGLAVSPWPLSALLVLGAAELFYAGNLERSAMQQAGLVTPTWRSRLPLLAALVPALGFALVAQQTGLPLPRWLGAIIAVVLLLLAVRWSGSIALRELRTFKD